MERWRSHRAEPNRKYYYITDKGQEALTEFVNNWEAIKTPVDQLMGRRKG